jgi:hypothetical protein
MADTRISREFENRDNKQRKMAWAPPETLPSPNPQDGWVFRWIRTSMMGQMDPTNTSAKMREGWEPVKAEDHPELMFNADPNSKFKGNVEIGGLLLCKAPREMADQRDAYYRQQSQNQMESVDNSFMREKDGRSNMSLFNDKKSSVSFGKGK